MNRGSPHQRSKSRCQGADPTVADATGFPERLQGLSDGIWDWNIRSGESRFSPNWCATLGHDIGPSRRGRQSLIDLLHADDVAGVEARLRAHLEERVPFDVDCRLRQAAGEHIWVRARAQAEWADDGTPLRLALSITDISTSKQAEEALCKSAANLDTAQRLARLGSYEWDPVTEDLVWSDETYRIFGVEKETFRPTTARFYAFIHPEDRAAVRAATGRAVQGTGSYDVSFRIIRPNGEERVLNELAEVDFDPQGAPYRMRGVIQDVTERARAVAEVRRLNEELEQRVEARTVELRAAQDSLLRQERLAAIGQLTATVAHELRHPLGALRSGVAAIKTVVGHDDPRLARAVALVDRSEVRCNKIIADLLDFTRAPTLEPKPTDLDGWLADALDDYPWPEGLTVRRDLDADLQVDLDPDRLRRVVTNVIDNACQALQGLDAHPSGSRGAEIVIASRAGGPRVEISITDNGPGIRKEDASQIFNPLFTTKSFGTGLGLPMVQQIMGQHGGGVEIASSAGRGTRVLLWMPRYAGHDMEDPVARVITDPADDATRDALQHHAGLWITGGKR